MKHIKILLLFSIFLVVTVSCGKSGTVPQPGPTGPIPITVIDNISLKLNGVSKSSSIPQAFYSKTAGLLEITSPFNTAESVTFVVKNAAPGTFSIPDGQATASYSLGSSTSGVYIATTGTITISTFNSTTVSGAFEFSGTNSNNENGIITDGLFAAHVIIQ